MSTTLETAVLDEILDPVSQCLTPEVARMLVALRASPATQARLDELADKCTEGQLTPDERSVYATYVQAIDFVSILQAKARRLLLTEASE
jgi:hypothetical protein